MKNLNKIRGCMLGGAVGDALRLPQIVEKYGERGITRYELADGVARISDDTQMSLFTANALLYGETRGCMRGIGAGPVGYFRFAYLNWFATQGFSYPLPDKLEMPRISWLLQVPALFSARAPGNTCLTALAAGGNGTVKKPVNRSKGCGGVMRVAPIGVYFAGKPRWSAKDAALAGADAAAVTHGHELGYLPAAALAHIVYSLAAAETPDLLAAVRSSLETVRELFPQAQHMNEFTDIMEKAILLAGQDTEERAAVRQLGEGWVAEETLAIAVYCALKHPHDFEKAIVAAVNHDGDSDSTGAVTGNILGTALGADAIPAFYLKDLELRDVMEELAEDLFNDCQMEEYGDYNDPVWKRKYIYADYTPDAYKEKNGKIKL